MKFIYPLFIALLIIQCTAKKQPAVKLVEPIEGSWQLDKLSNFTTPLDSVNRISTLKIILADSSYSGNSSCNNYQGNFTMNGDAIRFKPAMMTKMFCMDNYNLEPLFMKALDETNRYQIKEDKLFLYNKQTELAVFLRNSE